MGNIEKRPYGYIYRATNRVNGKVYVGQTVSSKWKEHQNPVKERWKEECDLAYRKQNCGEKLRYVEKAIIKYGPDNFDLKKQDKADNQKELDEKEQQWIKENDSMIPKGYNMTEGGVGGKWSQEVKENMSKAISDKWQDKEYREKQIKERQERFKDTEYREKLEKINRERGKDPKFQEKMQNINREKAKDPNFQEKMQNIIRERGKDPIFQEKVSKAITDKW